MTSHRIVTGSYTTPPPFRRGVGEGVSLLRFDDDTAAFELLDVFREVASPSYLKPHGGVVLAVSETDADAARIVTLGVEGDRLSLLGSAPIPGDAPCHIETHPSGRWAVTACYGSGHVPVYALDEAGLASGPISLQRHHGSSQHERRQRGPHAHGACFAPDGTWLLVTDLGTDEVWSHQFAPESGQIDDGPRRWKAPGGSGPRIALMTEDGGHVVLVTELANTLISLRHEDGQLAQVQQRSTFIEPWHGPSTAASLRWHPSMRAFAVSNRGSDTISLFGFDPDTGSMTPMVEKPCGGGRPRDFEFSPCGRWLLVCNQDSDQIAVLSLDLEAGHLEDTGLRQPVGTPSCVRFLPE